MAVPLIEDCADTGAGVYLCVRELTTVTSIPRNRS
jgi:hypothetical protein